jgi:ribose-phosphate pyrophosphokinase
MTTPLFIAMPGNEAMTRALVETLSAELGEIELRAFPDGESYVRLLSDVAGRSIAIVCTLARQTTKFYLSFFPQRPRVNSAR